MATCKRTDCPYYRPDAGFPYDAPGYCSSGLPGECNETDYRVILRWHELRRMNFVKYTDFKKDEMAMNESCFYVQNSKDLWRWDIVHRSTRKIVASILHLSTGFEYIAVNEKGVMCHGTSCRTVLEALDSYREDFEVKVV